VRWFGKPVGFAAPGFYADARLARIVDDLGFAYDGDAIGGPPRRNAKHWTIPVTVCGPGTVPFLENHAARGTARDAILAELDGRLQGNNPVVMYGHPCWEGVHADVLRDVFTRVLDSGFRFVTLAEIAASLEADTPRAAA
jgi:hypothetical protein